MQWSVASATHIGKRSEQQDRALVGDDFYAVFDGMGGHRNGALAAETARDTMKERIAAGDTALDAANAANEAVLDLDPYSRKMSSQGCPGTTLAGICPAQNTVIWCGDSHVYRLRDGDLTRLTEPHGVGRWISKCLGMPGKNRSEGLSLDPLPGDTYLICSDGLDHLPIDEVCDILCLLAIADVQDVTDALISAAAEHENCSDNITVVVAICT